MVVENQYPTRSETPSVFGCGYAALCFLQRLEYQYNNGRRKGRAFIGFMNESAEDSGSSDTASPQLLS
ncbi:MAG: hypothetical protein ACK5AZ_23725, partial [Bryobacteraceae bacterium]